MRHAATTVQGKWLRSDSLRALLLRRLLWLCVVAVLGWTAASVPAAAQPASSLFADLGADAVTFAPSPLSKTGEPAWITAPIPAEATGFVVQGTTPDRNLTGWVRFENGPWRTLHIVFSATGDTFFAGFHGEDVFTAGRFEIRFETRASIALTAAGVFDNRQDADRDEGAVEKRGVEQDIQGGGASRRNREGSSTGGRYYRPPSHVRQGSMGSRPFPGQSRGAGPTRLPEYGLPPCRRVLGVHA